MQTGVILAIAAACCFFLVIGVVVVVYFYGVACPDFGSDCPSGAPSPSRTPATSGTTPPVTPPPVTPAPSTPPASSSSTTCPANHYKFGANNTCVSCPYGTTSPAGSTNANQCIYPSGTCGANKYLSGGSCIDCPPGSYANQGSTSINDCYCGGNTTMKADKTGCNPCPAPPTGYVFSDPTGCAVKIQTPCYEAGPAPRGAQCCYGLSYNDGECY